MTCTYTPSPPTLKPCTPSPATLAPYAHSCTAVAHHRGVHHSALPHACSTAWIREGVLHSCCSHASQRSLRHSATLHSAPLPAILCASHRRKSLWQGLKTSCWLHHWLCWKPVGSHRFRSCEMATVTGAIMWFLALWPHCLAMEIPISITVIKQGVPYYKKQSLISKKKTKRAKSILCKHIFQAFYF